MKKVFVTFLLIAAFLPSFCQNLIGLPEVLYYSKQAYNGGSQNWDIAQGENGIMYFANNDGLLTFDGSFWKLYSLPNKSSVRSIAIAADGRIYVGGQNEIGYFFPDKTGSLVYTSLKNLIPAGSQSFDDIWQIVIIDKDIYFRSYRYLFQLSHNGISVKVSKYGWSYITSINNKLLAQDLHFGLYTLEGSKATPYTSDTTISAREYITSIVPFDRDTLLIATQKSGLFFISHDHITPFSNPGLVNIAKQIIYKVKVTEKDIVVGTSLGGCYILNRQGKIINKFSVEEGAENSNIRSIYLDKEKNLWLGLDKGINFIEFNSAIKSIAPKILEGAAGYASIIYNNDLYLGTSNGLYKTPLQSGLENFSFAQNNLKLIPNTNGQVWNLSEVYGKLIMGHAEGPFIIESAGAKAIDNSIGHWNFSPFQMHGKPEMMVSGYYKGVALYNYNNNSFQATGSNAEFESSRFLVVDKENTVWVAHPYKGIYQVRFSDHGATVQLYNQQKEIFSANNNVLFNVKGKLVSCSEKGIYEFDYNKRCFVPSVFFKNIFKDAIVGYLKEDAAGNIWFKQDKMLGVVDMSSSKPRVIYFTELYNKTTSVFTHIYPYNNHNIMIGGENGFYHIDLEKYKSNHNNSFKTEVRLVRSFGSRDSLLNGGYATSSGKKQQAVPDVKYKNNSVHFEYSAILFGQQLNLQYSYYLEGYESKWSGWTKRTEKEYTNLPPGYYTFRVKARNNLGSESTIGEYKLRVLPPWYRTVLAYIIYVLLIACAITYLYKRQQRKFLNQQKEHDEEQLRQQMEYEKEQKRQKYLHQLEQEAKEKEIIKLQNEKLEADLQHKNSELASSAMHLIQKGELLEKIKEELLRIRKTGAEDKTSEELKKISKIVKEVDRTDKDWETFEARFDQVHNEFFKSLKRQHRNLSATDLRLCAYLRMNMSSKEIAQLSNISVKGVELSRYRLRKKFELTTDVNLYDYMLSFGE